MPAKRALSIDVPGRFGTPSVPVIHRVVSQCAPPAHEVPQPSGRAAEDISFTTAEGAATTATEEIVLERVSLPDESVHDGSDAASEPPANLACAPDNPWSRLHVNSCLGRAVRVDGALVFTGEGYDPSADKPEPAPSAYHAEDLAFFPAEFPLASARNTILSRLIRALSPRFADEEFEQRYQHQRGQGLGLVQLCFMAIVALFCAALWASYLPSEQGLDRQRIVGISLMHGALLILICFWAVLRAAPCARRHSSELHALQAALIVSLFCWGLPATARELCSDASNSFDDDLHQTVFVAIAYAGIFVRIGTGDFALLCLFTVANFTLSRAVWSHLEGHPFAPSFEVSKLVAMLCMLGAGVRRIDMHLRREFAAREVMLMLIGEQEREMMLKSDSAREIGTPPLMDSMSSSGPSSTPASPKEGGGDVEAPAPAAPCPGLRPHPYTVRGAEER